MRRGATGSIVARLHAAIAAAGDPVIGDEPEVFGPATEEAIRTFQRARGLQVDGVCGRETWAALDECRRRLGDRLLALREPMQRGDDVRALQQGLSRLGFDPGRVDGIFGPRTSSALGAFQRDAGLAADAVCGPQTLDALRRWSGLADGAVSSVREQLAFLATPRTLAGRRIHLVARDELTACLVPLREQLAAAGVIVSSSDPEDDDRSVADAARDADVDLCLVVQPFDDPACRTAYYGTADYGSLRGHAVALSIEAALQREFPRPGCTAVARTFGILREARMPSVVVQPTDTEVGDRTDAFVTALCAGIRAGYEAPPQ